MKGEKLSQLLSGCVLIRQDCGILCSKLLKLLIHIHLEVIVLMPKCIHSLCEFNYRIFGARGLSLKWRHMLMVLLFFLFLFTCGFIASTYVCLGLILLISSFLS